MGMSGLNSGSSRYWASVSESAAHGFCENVEIVRGIVPHLAQVVFLEDIQYLDLCHTP